MCQFVREAVLVFVCATMSFACVKSDPGRVDGAAGAPGGAGGGAGAGGGGGAGGGSGMPDSRPAVTMPVDCKGIRDCVFTCDKDTACAGRCVSSAPMAARTLYEMIRTCSVRECPTQDTSCRCDHECYGGGECSDMVEQCDEAGPDLFCDPAGVSCGL
jgi:hypothetical protein